MQFETLLTNYELGILTVTVNRPKAMNALNHQVFSDLDEVFSTYAPSLQGLIGVIVTGAGEKAFVAGADITEFTTLTAETASRLAKRGHDIFDTIENFPRPVIAVVNGYALGGGCELAMACHLRIAEEKAMFGQPEVNLGIIPGYAGTQRLVRYVGKAKALELIITADMINGEEACRLGLANYVVPTGEGVAKAKSILAKVAKKAPIAVTKAMQCINAYYTKNGAATEVHEFGQCADTLDFKEGVAAFLEKRKAVFQGK
jgi:enoyl-CoA hydratase